MSDNEARALGLGLILIVMGLLSLFDIGIFPAQAQYGGGWGIYGPYGRPPPGAYDYPPGYIPPIPRQRQPWGPQVGPCIYDNECRDPRRWGAPWVPPRRYWGQEEL